MADLEIIIDDLTGSKIKALLEEHLRDMKGNTPPESIHALDLDALKAPDITFWSAWNSRELFGCVALKRLNDRQVELKSMRTATAHRRKGVAKQLLNHVLTFATMENYHSINLETGSGADFEPARKLYTSAGFTYCAPFANYLEDPNSIFMTKSLIGKQTHA